MKNCLSQKDIDTLNSFDIQTKNSIINLFKLAQIEDRYTEANIMLDACVAIKMLLSELRK